MIPYKGDRSITHFDETICNKHMYYMATIGRPFCIYSATTEMLIPMVCFIWATFEQPAYLETFVRLFWTFIKNLMPTMASMAISEHPVYHLKMTSATIRPYKKKLASFMVAQGRPNTVVSLNFEGTKFRGFTINGCFDGIWIRGFWIIAEKRSDFR